MHLFCKISIGICSWHSKVHAHPPSSATCSLASHLRTAAPLGREAIFFHYPHYHHLGDMRPASAIRAERYKLIEWHEGALLGRGPAVSLFDLTADPGEQNDLAATQPERAAQLRAKLDRWLASVDAQTMTVRAAQPRP